MPTIENLKDGLYEKNFHNSICEVEGKLFTFKRQAITPALVRIKKGEVFLADNKGQIVEPLIEIEPEAITETEAKAYPQMESETCH